jgi:hypothetical protein
MRCVTASPALCLRHSSRNPHPGLGGRGAVGRRAGRGVGDDVRGCGIIGLLEDSP